MRTTRLGSLTSPEVNEAAQSGIGVIVPIGATEQHGPHLPLDTDAVLAEHLAYAVAEPTQMLVAPPITYGYRSRPLSGGGEGFPGTISISARTLMCLVEDVLAGLIRSGFIRLCLLNWHFENSNFIYEAAWLAQTAQPERAQVMVIEAAFAELSEAVMQTMFADVEFRGWDVEHAAVLETSLMLHLQPERVLFDRAVDDASEEHPTYDVIPAPASFIPTSGTLWKARAASAAKGQVAWEEITDRVCSSISHALAPTVEHAIQSLAALPSKPRARLCSQSLTNHDTHMRAE